jgi:hypothetical protein
MISYDIEHAWHNTSVDLPQEQRFCKLVHLPPPQLQLGLSFVEWHAWQGSTHRGVSLLAGLRRGCNQDWEETETYRLCFEQVGLLLVCAVDVRDVIIQIKLHAHMAIISTVRVLNAGQVHKHQAPNVQ